MVTDPEGTVDRCTDEETSTGPSVNIVELLVAMSGAEEEGDDRVFGTKEKYNRKLCKGEET